MELGIILAFLGTIILGTAKITAKQAVMQNGQYRGATLIHGSVAATVLLAYLLFSKEQFSLPQDLSYFFWTILIGTAAILCLYKAYENGNFSIASAISQSSFALTAIILVFFFGEHISSRQIGGMAFVFIGIIALSLIKNKKLYGTFIGTSWAFGTFVGWGIFFAMIKSLLLQGGPYMSVLWIEGSIFLSVAAFSVIIKQVKFHLNELRFKPAILTGVQVGIGVLLMYGAFRMISASIATTILQASVIIPVIGGRIFFKEQLSKLQLTAIGVILAGLILLV